MWIVQGPEVVDVSEAGRKSDMRSSPDFRKDGSSVVFEDGSLGRVDEEGNAGGCSETVDEMKVSCK